MCFRELLEELKRTGVSATESQIRWAIKTGKVNRPRVDGSLRFDFAEKDLADLAAYLTARREVASHA